MTWSRGVGGLSSNEEIVQADVGPSELRRRATRPAQAAAPAVCREYLNDLKSMADRISDAEKCSIIGCQIRRLGVDIRENNRDRQSQVEQGDRHISTRRSHRMCHEVSKVCQKLCKRPINTSFCDCRISGILTEQEISRILLKQSKVGRN